VGVIATLFLAACNGRPHDATSAKDAIKITNKYWKEQFPQVNLKNLSVRTIDMNDRWKVNYYDASDDRHWPVSVFEVEKKSGEIVKVKGGQ
jgi:hypothetical protein